MLGWAPPGTWEIFDLARVANLSWISGGMTLSASPMTYQEGIVFHPTAAGALSVVQRAASGRCVAANRAATSAGSADANTVPKYLELTYRSASLPVAVVKGTAIVKSDGDDGALA